MSWEFIETGLETPKWISKDKWVSIISIYGGVGNNAYTTDDYKITYNVKTKQYTIDWKDDKELFRENMCDIDIDFRDNL